MLDERSERAKLFECGMVKLNLVGLWSQQSSKVGKNSREDSRLRICSWYLGGGVITGCCFNFIITSQQPTEEKRYYKSTVVVDNYCKSKE